MALFGALLGTAPSNVLSMMLVVATGGVVFGFTYSFSNWAIAVVRELDHGREAEAELAVARERLRFSRDLHDVVVRNLSVISLKSELAIELAQRRQEEAITQMVEVQRIARESQDEVRAVVRGYRTADLRTELVGASSVLRSAGVDCRVTGDIPLSGEQQACFAWSVREGTTNVIRHSEALICEINLYSSSGKAWLTMENDGAHPQNPDDTLGSGLAGIRDRLAAIGGEMDVRFIPGGRFRLSVCVPAD
ncbi:hypothetical protein GCM10027589_13290 [Actinocorallia lasiicapitis]